MANSANGQEESRLVAGIPFLVASTPSFFSQAIGSSWNIEGKPLLRLTAMPPEVSDDPHRYLAGSITSETEFVLNNYDSILLRLPIGSYEVALRHHIPANDEWENDPPLLGSSEMAWTKTRPKVVVNSLQTTVPN